MLPAMTPQLDYSDLLTKFEQENLREPYKEYYATKRHNFFVRWLFRTQIRG
jgi:hypothetical protein